MRRPLADTQHQRLQGLADPQGTLPRGAAVRRHHQLAALVAAGYRAVAPFQRGYAPTSVPASGLFQSGVLGVDANALHEALGADGDAVIIGHDWGASGTYTAATLEPNRWRKVVAMAVPPGPAIAMAFLGNFDQLKRSWYMFFFQHPLSDHIVASNDMAFIDRLWTQWSPGYDGTDDARRVKQSLTDPAHLSAAGMAEFHPVASNETPELMPAPIMFAHRLGRELTKIRKSGKVPWLRPDAKSQVSVRYEDGRPVEVVNVVISTQHSDKVSQETIREELVNRVINKVIPAEMMDKKTKIYTNPTGRFVVAGPHGDAGVTGRKIIVDTYGGAAPHGGGAFSGKDSTKVDRSAAYAARYLAKNVVAAGLADRCLIQVAYAIGVADPMSLYVNTEGTGKVDERKLERVLADVFPLRPTNIRRGLQLNKPIYQRTAAYGHFGRKPDRDGGFSWERLDLVPELKRAFHAR